MSHIQQIPSKALYLNGIHMSHDVGGNILKGLYIIQSWIKYLVSYFSIRSISSSEE